MIKINPSKRNVNLHTEQGMHLLETSIDKVGVIESISVTKEGTIISGHARSELFNKKGMIAKEIHLEANEYPVIVTDIQDNTKQYFEAQILANTTANRNFDLDTDLIDEIAVEYDIDIEEVGVEVVEEDPEPLEAKEDDFDTTPPTQPITVLGDIYEIGEHRLLCGDSTDSDQVAKLMNGEKADMVFTDPPYGYKYESNYQRKHKELLNDDKILNFLPNVFLFSKENIAIFIFCGWQTITEWINEINNNSFDLKNVIIWKKNNWSMGDLKGAYAGQYEVILFAHKGRIELKNGRGQDVWEFDREPPKEHPTMKPIELIEKALNDTTNQNDLIADLFLGSGSTMVASHQLKRKCYGMELDPKYCDVIVKRMIKLDPILVIKRNGVVTKDFE
jgi:DNA modification methylase